ncbi:Rrf2 family transcriptional regulator [Leptobacterium sp. I13]|uniref:RrF2 family transcriptional regulator n=1 Tax=Leptobacterium meishanense TaxID=3128904 RepID=UPI0030ED33C6
MFSNPCKYAINAVIYLAVNSGESRKVGAKKIAKAIDVPAAFLAKLLQDLVKKGIISSIKGPNGGFYLTDNNKEMKMISIVEQIDGLSKFDECILGLKECNSERPCPVHHKIQPYKKQLYDELKNNSIGHFAEKVSKGETFLSY